MFRKGLYVLLLSLWGCESQNINNSTFPTDFLFGTATAAYQVEGAWNVSGKGENIWDHLTHNNSSIIADRSNGDVACNSYYKIEEDINILKDLGVDFHRFSLSWSRILPTGYSTTINPDGLRYYHHVLDLLQSANIRAMVSIYHWDLPQPLQELGGWTNSSIIDVYAEFARIAFENFGDRVDTWFTFNEPYQICREGYGSAEKAPAINNTGISDYLCGHNLLRSHARAYHLYNETYRSRYNGKIGIVVQAPWAEPVSSNVEDVEAAERLMQFYFGWFTHPIFSEGGDYPEVMKTNIGYRSALEGFSVSRLPAFTTEEIQYLKGTSDFFGLNHYTSVIASARNASVPISRPSYTYDINITFFYDPSWPAGQSTWLRIVPWGFEKLLLYIHREYNGTDIYITENGYSDTGTIEDDIRINYHQGYLSAVLNAIEQGVSVKTYTVWSLLDNFEWFSGYTEKFGLIHIDFENDNRKRTYKKSANFIKYVFRNKKITGYSCSETLRKFQNKFTYLIFILFGIFC